VWGTFHVLRAEANALSAPPGEYGRSVSRRKVIEDDKDDNENKGEKRKTK